MSKYLFHYKKYGLLRYLSHHETVSMVERIFRRTGTHIERTQGFHQRMKLSFGQALTTGIIDRAGLFVGSSEDDLDGDFVREANLLSPKGFEFSGVEEVPSNYKLSSVLEGYVFKLIFSEKPSEKFGEKVSKIGNLWIGELFRPFNSSFPRPGEFDQYLTIREKAIFSEVKVEQSSGN